MNIWIPLLILLLIAILGVFGGKSAGAYATNTVPLFEKFDSDQSLGYGNLPFKHFPSNKKLMRNYWGPYLWGWKNRPFYDYQPNTRAPYPYQFECNDYANQMCGHSCDPYCYKKNFLKCSAGVALVDPGKLCGGDFPNGVPSLGLITMGVPRTSASCNNTQPLWGRQRFCQEPDTAPISADMPPFCPLNN